MGAQGVSRQVESRAAKLWRWRWPVLVLVVFLVANHLVLRGRAVPIWDAATQAFPYFVLVADHARAGQLVQWDPWTEAGLPLGGDPQVGAYSPIVVALGFLFGGHSSTFIAYWLLSWALGAVGVMVLGRHLGAPLWGACVVALGFLFSGVYAGNAEHLSWVVSFSFLPLILWRLDAALTTRSPRAAVQAGALWGLSALAGHPAIIMLGGGYAALWSLGRWLFADARQPAGQVPNAGQTAPGQSDGAHRNDRSVPLTFALRALVLMGAVGIVVLSPTYVAAIRDGTGVHSRSGPLPKREALVNELPPGALVTFASAYPLRAKAEHQRDLWPRSDVSMVSVYAGVLIPVLAIFALVAHARDGWRWWIAALGLLSLAFAMGQTLPFHGWLYDTIYPVRFFRHSSVFRVFYLVSVTVLALLGTREIALAIEAQDVRRRRWFAHLAFATAFAASVAYALFLVGVRDVPTHRLAPALIATWLGPIAVGVFLRDRRARVLHVAALLMAVAVADALVASVVSRPTIMESGYELERWRQVERQHRASLELTPHGLRRIAASCEDWDPTRWCDVNHQMITKVPVLHAYSSFKNSTYRLFVNDPLLRAASVGGDRIWFSPEIAEVPRTDSAIAAFVRRTHAVGGPPLVVHRGADLVGRTSPGTDRSTDSAIVARISALPAARRIATQVIGYEPNELTLAVVAPQAGWLLVTDRWAPRWRVTVNGQPANLFGGAFVYRAVPIAAGRSVLQFNYRASGFPFLVAASWGTLALVLLGALRRGRAMRPAAAMASVSAAAPGGRPAARSD